MLLFTEKVPELCHRCGTGIDSGTKPGHHGAQLHIDPSATVVRKDKEPEVPRDREAPGSQRATKGSFGGADAPNVGGGGSGRGC